VGKITVHNGAGIITVCTNYRKCWVCPI